MEQSNLKAQAMALKPAIIIGKNGLTQNTIDQIALHLKANKLTKIKISRNFLDETQQPKQEIAQEIATKTKSEIIQQVGFVVVLYKR